MVRQKFRVPRRQVRTFGNRCPARMLCRLRFPTDLAAAVAISFLQRDPLRHRDRECDASAWVQLYFPTLRQIVRQSDSAANILASERGPTAEIAKHLADAARALLEQLPKTGHDEALEHAAEEAASKLKRKGK